MAHILLGLLLLLAACMPELPPEGSSNGRSMGAQGRCGTGSWQPGWLEIHHIDAGQAMATLIVSPDGQSLLVDAGEGAPEGSRGAETVGAYVGAVLGCATLDYVMLTHFHLDHAGVPGKGGLWHLVQRQGFSVGKLLHRDLYRYAGTGAEMLARWRSYLQSPEGLALHPEIAVLGKGQIVLGGLAFAIVAVDGAGVLLPGDFATAPAPPDENDYAIAFVLRMGRLDYFAAGDLSGETLVSGLGDYSYHDIETRIAPSVRDVDVYRVSHHGSSHASNATLLAQLQPRVAILQVGDGNGHGHPSQDAVDRLRNRSALFLTERGEPSTALGAAKVVGHVVLRTTTGSEYAVAGDHFTASDPVRRDEDGDGYFAEADPDDRSGGASPPGNGGCDPAYQACP